MHGRERPEVSISEMAKSLGHDVFFAVVIIATTVHPLERLNSSEEMTKAGRRFFTSIS